MPLSTAHWLHFLSSFISYPQLFLLEEAKQGMRWIVRKGWEEANDSQSVDDGVFFSRICVYATGKCSTRTVTHEKGEHTQN